MLISYTLFVINIIINPIPAAINPEFLCVSCVPCSIRWLCSVVSCTTKGEIIVLCVSCGSIVNIIPPTVNIMPMIVRIFFIMLYNQCNAFSI